MNPVLEKYTVPPANSETNLQRSLLTSHTSPDVDRISPEQSPASSRQLRQVCSNEKLCKVFTMSTTSHMPSKIIVAKSRKERQQLLSNKSVEMSPASTGTREPLSVGVDETTPAQSIVMVSIPIATPLAACSSSNAKSFYSRIMRPNTAAAIDVGTSSSKPIPRSKQTSLPTSVLVNPTTKKRVIAAPTATVVSNSQPPQQSNNNGTTKILEEMLRRSGKRARLDEQLMQTSRQQRFKFDSVGNGNNISDDPNGVPGEQLMDWDSSDEESIQIDDSDHSSGSLTIDLTN